jgi:2-alkenal reductase
MVVINQLFLKRVSCPANSKTFPFNGETMKRTAWTPFIIILMLSLALMGCAGLTAQDEAITQPAVNTVETVPDSAVITAPPASEETSTNSAQTEPPAPPLPEEGIESLFAQEEAFIAIYERVNPSVVHIGVGGGQGSGFVYDRQGHIVTNNHVVAGAGQIAVAFADGRIVEAELVGTDPDSDLAVIKVDVPTEQLVPVTIADSDQLNVGQIVIAIGNPFGLSGTMTTGIISSLDRELDGAQYLIPDVIQTDAAINPGNSGGPLLDLQGHVIGVNSAIRSASNSSSGVGFAVPANIVQAVAPQLIATGSVSHPWLGIAGGTLSPNAIEELGLNGSTGGVIISSVVANGPAEAAGLRGGNGQGLGGDIITAIDGRRVQLFDDLLGYIVQHTTVGQTVTLEVLRDGNTITVPLTLGARPSSG